MFPASITWIRPVSGGINSSSYRMATFGLHPQIVGKTGVNGQLLSALSKASGGSWASPLTGSEFGIKWKTHHRHSSVCRKPENVRGFRTNPPGLRRKPKRPTQWELSTSSQGETGVSFVVSPSAAPGQAFRTTAVGFWTGPTGPPFGPPKAHPPESLSWRRNTCSAGGPTPGPSGDIGAAVRPETAEGYRRS